MTVTTHQPIFLPWTGFFLKAIKADCMVLLDDVQFPLGRGWINRNRLKNKQGELWLTVPVYKKGRGFQTIRDVEIFNQFNWKKKHVKGIYQNYLHAPFFNNHFHAISDIYNKEYKMLLNFNLELIRYIWNVLGLNTMLVLQSELGISGKGTALLVDICKKLKAVTYITLSPAEKHIQVESMKKKGISIHFLRYYPAVYPQLWGDFIFNLSTMDLLLNCGQKSREIIEKGLVAERTV